MIEAAKEKSPTKYIEYFGFDYSNNKKTLRNVKNKLNETGCEYNLYRGPSTKTLPEVVDELPMMDLIFIDGGKKYETVKSGLENSKKLMKEDTTIFVHNCEFSEVKKGVNDLPKEEFNIEIIDPKGDYKTGVIKKK